MISTRSTGFDIGVCLGLKLGPLGYAKCPGKLGAGSTVINAVLIGNPARARAKEQCF